MTSAKQGSKKGSTQEPTKNASFFSRVVGRLGPGGLGPLPVLIGLAAIWTVFTIANPRFLSAVNLTNMMLQIAAVGTISVGVVMVLLLGEIDLSVGSVSGFAAGVMAVLSVKSQMPAVPALLIGILAGVAIGAFNGFIVTRFRVHSLVVTLAGLLGFQGALLYVLGRHRDREPSGSDHHGSRRHLFPSAGGMDRSRVGHCYLCCLRAHQ